MNDQDVIRLTPIIEQEARMLANDTSAVLDTEDISQEMWAYAITRWADLTGKDDGFFRVSVRKAGRKYCMDERYAYVHNSAQYVYTPKEVRSLFKAGYFDADSWESVPGKSDYRLSLIDDNGSVVVALWDLQAGFDSLRRPDQQIIERRYRDGETLDGADRMRLTRAVDAVTRFLNNKILASQETRENYDDGPGARRVLTNAHALAITE